MLELEAAQRSGGEDPEALNAAFRAIHSLKGLAGLFAAGPIATLSHSLENALDGLRLGRVALTAATLDVLFEAVETFAALLAAFEQSEPGPEIEPLLGRVAGLLGASEPERATTGLPGIDESILGVLTEYEGTACARTCGWVAASSACASFDLLAIDVGIEGLKGKLKEFGEVITYLPSAASAEDRIDLDLLLGSNAELALVAEALAAEGVTCTRWCATPARRRARAAPRPRPRPSHRAPA
ncbi:MAG: Hpt domain-containing protein [Nannocystaceae bacterium]